MTPSAIKQPQLRLGRPTEADTRHIAQIAVQLFEERGFEAVTMEDVARAAAVSRRTLFRHFPAKADLVWTGVAELLAVLRGLAEPYKERRLALAGLVDALFVPVLVLLDEPETAEFARRRLRLIAGAPTLLTHPMLREVGGLLAEILDEATLPAGTSAPLVAHTLVAAAFASLQWWAEHGAGHGARETLLGALRGVATAMAGGASAAR